jgi:hypothetical protein
VLLRLASILSVIKPFRFFNSMLLVLRKIGWLLLILVLLESLLDQWVTAQMQTLLADPQGTPPTIYAFGLFSMLLSLTFPACLVVLVMTTLSGSWQNLIGNFNHVLIESLRAWGRTLNWTLLFIIPGLYKWLKLSLVPLVVLLSNDYQDGKLDALDESENLTKGQLLHLVFIFSVFGIVLPTLMTQFDEYRNLWHTPLSAIGLGVFETLASVVFCLWLVKIYLKPLREDYL